MISVIVPAYNAEKTIERCISSVLKENNAVECIVVNDGSKDNTKNILYQLANNYSNLTVIDIPNGGVSRARNIGMDNASSDWILFLDADDELVEGWYDIVDKQISSNDCDILLFEYLNDVPGSGRFVTKYSIQSNASITRGDINRLLFTTPELNTCWGKVFKRDLILNKHIIFPDGIKFGEDAIFVENVCSCTEKIQICRIPLVIYYFNPSSTMRTGTIKKRLNDGIRLLNNRLRCVRLIGANDLLDEVYIHHFRTITAMMIDIGKIPEKNVRAEEFALLQHHDYTKRIMDHIDISRLGHMKKFEYLLLKRFYRTAPVYFELKGKFRKENTF